MIETLGDAVRAGWVIHVACAYGPRDGMKSVAPCIERYVLDSQTLIWTRGRDIPLTRLAERMKCPRCGCRRVRLSFVPPDHRAVGDVTSREG